MPPWILFLVFGVLFFLMMRGGCGSHAGGHGHDGHSRQRHDTAEPPEKTLDPVCGMTVETKTAKSAAYEGRVFYFCSAKCRDRFESSPAAYAAARPESTVGMEHQHG